MRAFLADISRMNEDNLRALLRNPVPVDTVRLDALTRRAHDRDPARFDACYTEAHAALPSQYAAHELVGRALAWKIAFYLLFHVTGDDDASSSDLDALQAPWETLVWTASPTELSELVDLAERAAARSSAP